MLFRNKWAQPPRRKQQTEEEKTEIETETKAPNTLKWQNADKIHNPTDEEMKRNDEKREILYYGVTKTKSCHPLCTVAEF